MPDMVASFCLLGKGIRFSEDTGGLRLLVQVRGGRE